jgi:hypothetical protein
MLKAKARLLERVMTDLSEEYYCAQWLTGLEYNLWADLTGQAVRGKSGLGISPEEKEELALAHEIAGGWLRWSEETSGVVYLSTPQWLAHLASSEHDPAR